MPRVPLLIALAAAVAAPAAAQFPGRHLEGGVLSRPCSGCHRSHGVAATPLLADASEALCLGCHSAEGGSPAGKARLGIATNANPADIGNELAKPSTHRHASCLQCHSVHGVPSLVHPPVPGQDLGRIRPPTKRQFASQTELCLSCHGTRGPRSGDVDDLAAKLAVSNPSFHPVLGPGVAASAPSLKLPLTPSSVISCGDCHASDDQAAPRGPHGSRTAGILAGSYAATDGQVESATTYGFCYRCHDREVVLDRDAFPQHRAHVVDEKASCASCHEPHGATSARALVRFNEPTAITGVTPSSSGRLAFVSTGPGAGSCYLTCHGKNHDPLGYGLTPPTVNPAEAITNSSREPRRHIGQPGADPGTSRPRVALPGDPVRPLP